MIFIIVMKHAVNNNNNNNYYSVRPKVKVGYYNKVSLDLILQWVV